ncbi:MAG: SBBP repeat-containing protein, partial [Polyangiaceae bacterium]|nr:SBBP repeat-containing protein [Polyangiaceae bacterium]
MMRQLVLVSVVLLGAACAVAQEVPIAPFLSGTGEALPAGDPATRIVPEAGTDGAQAVVQAAFGKLPLYFVEDRRLCPEGTAYFVQGAHKTLFFTPNGITFRLKGQDQSWVVKLEFVGRNPNGVLHGEDRQEAVFSYFRGPKEEWRAGLPTFSKVVYRELWPGIDLVYRGTANELKYEFVLKPGADPGQIRLRYRGAERVTPTDSGALRVSTRAGSFEDAPPVAWQEIEGTRMPVAMAYRVETEATYGFDLGPYDAAYSLVLDPAVLVYCGYIGGSDSDSGTDIAVDTAGNAYVTGYTSSTAQTFPATVGPDLTHSGLYDIFVAKLDAAGTALVYCGYIGGSGDDIGSSIAVDAAGSTYITGRTTSTEQTLPVTVGPDLTYNGGTTDAFVAKVNAAGTGLVYCGYVGGSNDDPAFAIAVDLPGNAYITGRTASTEQTFPVTVGPDLTFNGGTYDTFVAKIDSTGSTIVYCGYIGGIATDSGHGIAVDTFGSAYIVGSTGSTEQTFPVAVGPDLTYNGTNDGFVAKVNAAGTGLAYCGYVGGSGEDYGSGDIAVDVAGNAYIAGRTSSIDLPVAVGPDRTYNGGMDVFVAKINSDGSTVVYCGYIGGSALDSSCSIAVDTGGSAYVMGYTGSTEPSFPVTAGPDLTHNGGNTDVFVTKVNPQGTALDYCGYIGGSGSEFGNGVAVDAAGNAYVMGYTGSTEQTFPVTAGPKLTYNGGAYDAFVAKVSATLLTGTGTP